MTSKKDARLEELALAPEDWRGGIFEVGDRLGRSPGEVFDHFYNGAFVLGTTPVERCLLTR